MARLKLHTPRVLRAGLKGADDGWQPPQGRADQYYYQRIAEQTRQASNTPRKVYFNSVVKHTAGSDITGDTSLPRAP